MDVLGEHREHLEKLASETYCRWNHGCLTSNLERLTPVEVVAGGRVLFCFSENAERCHHSEPFGGTMLCTCPIRRYIAEHLQ
jgi:hypothetical protein